MENIMKNKIFSFYHLTDLHYYATDKIGSFGKYFKIKCDLDQKCMEESGAIIDATFDKIITDNSTDVVVITGDNTFDGEIESHDDLIIKLNHLKASGKKVFVTFATHDFNMEAKRFTDQGEFLIAKYNREQLREIYSDFGWDEAVSEHKGSYSYAVTPFPGYRFLMLNDDGDGLEFCGFYEDLLQWIKQQTAEAEKAGERVIAFTHHPVLPPAIIYPLHSHRDMLGGYETTTPYLASCNIQFVFTGHTHMQSISKSSWNGKSLYHINTGSAIAYPLPYRRIDVYEDGLDISTEHIDSFDWPLNGKDVLTYSKDHFEHMLRDIFYSAENDTEKFKQLAKGFSLDSNTIEKYKFVFNQAGKLINRLTFKTLGKILFVSNKIDKSVENILVRDFLLEIVRNMFTGQKPYTPDTYEYIAFMAIIGRVKRFIRLKDKDGNVVPGESIFIDLLYNTDEYDNNNCFLPYVN